MSWYVRTLLLDSYTVSKIGIDQYVDSVKSNEDLEKVMGTDLLTVFQLLNLPTVTSAEFVEQIDEISYYTLVFDDDDYNNLLFLCKKIKELYKSGSLSKYEVSIISKIMNGDHFIDIANSLGKKDMRPIKKDFYDVCNRLAFALGG